MNIENLNDMIGIPKRFRIGGQDIEVKEVERCENDNLGLCCVAEGVIEIGKTFRGKIQCDSVRLNTFYHELTHSILDTMGENELSSNEKFVSTFSSFLTEAIRSFKYE